MTADEMRDFLKSDGLVDCGDSFDIKQDVLDMTESLGFRVGFDRKRAGNYRYVYYDVGCEEIHMYGSAHGEKVVSWEMFLDIVGEQPEPAPLSDLYDWAV